MIFLLPVQFQELAKQICRKAEEQYGENQLGVKVDEHGFCIACNEMSLVVGKPVGVFAKLPVPTSENDDILIPMRLKEESATYYDEAAKRTLPSIAVFGPNGVITPQGIEYPLRLLKLYTKMKSSPNENIRDSATIQAKVVKNMTYLGIPDLLMAMDLFAQMPNLLDHRSGEPCIPFKNRKNNQMIIYSNPEFLLYIRHNATMTAAIKETIY